jgi:hypothetical protein
MILGLELELELTIVPDPCGEGRKDLERIVQRIICACAYDCKRTAVIDAIT